MNPSQDKKSNGRRSSILKPPKVRNPLSDLDVKTEDDVTVTRSTRRVSFASNNTIKPFKIDNDRNTVWDSTYEEEVTPSDIQTSSNQNRISVGSNVVEFAINASRDPSLVPSEVGSDRRRTFDEESLNAINVECSFISDIPTEGRIITEGNKLMQDAERQFIPEKIQLAEVMLPSIKDIKGNISKSSVTQSTYVNKCISEQKKLSLPGSGFNPFLKLSTVKEPHTYPTLNRYSVATSTQKLGENIKKNNDENIHPILGTKPILRLNPRSSKQQISTTLSLQSETIEHVSLECKRNSKEATFFSKSFVKTDQNVFNSQNDQNRVDNSGFSSDMELTDEIPASVMPLTAIDNQEHLIHVQNSHININFNEIVSVSETQIINSQNCRTTDAKTTLVTKSDVQVIKNDTIKELNDYITQTTVHFDSNHSEANMKMTEDIARPVLQPVLNENKRRTIHLDNNDSEANMEMTEHIDRPFLQPVINESKRKTMHFDNDSEADMEMTEHIDRPVLQPVINEKKRKNILFDNDSEADTEMTEVIARSVLKPVLNENKRKTIHFDNNDSEANMEMTEDIVQPILQPVLNENKRKTIHFDNNDSEANMEMTEHIDRPVLQSVMNEKKRKTIHFDNNDSNADMEMTGHIDGPLLQPVLNENKKKTIHFDNNDSEANMEMTEVIARSVLQPVLNENKRKTIHFDNNDSGANMEMAEDIVQPILQPVLNENKRKTIHFDNNDSEANMEMTEVIARSVLQPVLNENKRKTIHFDNNDSDANMEMTEDIVQPILQPVLNENKRKTIHFDNNDSEANMEMTEVIARSVLQPVLNENKRKTIHFDNNDSDANMEMTEDIVQPILQPVLNENKRKTINFDNNDAEANMEMTEVIAQSVLQPVLNENKRKTIHFDNNDSDANMEMTEDIVQPILQPVLNENKRKTINFDNNDAEANMEMTEHIDRPVLQSIMNENKRKTIHFDNNDSDGNMEMTEIIPAPVCLALKNGKNSEKINLDNLSDISMKQLSVPLVQRAVDECNSSHPNLEQPKEISDKNKKVTIHFNVNKADVCMKAIEEIPLKVSSSENKEKAKNNEPNSSNKTTLPISNIGVELTEQISASMTQPYSDRRVNEREGSRTRRNLKDSQIHQLTELPSPSNGNKRRKTEAYLKGSQISIDGIHRSECQSFSIEDKRNSRRDDNEEHCVFGLRTNSIFVTDKFSYEKKEVLGLKNSQNNERVDTMPAVDEMKKDNTHKVSVFPSDLDNETNLIEEKNENTGSKSALSTTCNFEQSSTLMESTQTLINAKTSLIDTLRNNLLNSCTAAQTKPAAYSYSLSENKENSSFGESVGKLSKSVEEVNAIDFDGEAQRNFEHNLVIEKDERRTVEKAQSTNFNTDCSTSSQTAEVYKIIDDKNGVDNKNLEISVGDGIDIDDENNRKKPTSDPVIVISDDSDSSSETHTPSLKDRTRSSRPEENYKSLVTNLEGESASKSDDDAAKQNMCDISATPDIDEGEFMYPEMISTDKNNEAKETDYSIHDFSAFAFKQDSLIMLEKTTIDLVSSDTEDDATLKANDVTLSTGTESSPTARNAGDNTIGNDYNIIEMENKTEFVLEQNRGSNFNVQAEKNANERLSDNFNAVIENGLIKQSSTEKTLPTTDVSNDSKSNSHKLSRETVDVKRELTVLESIRQQQTRKDCLWKMLLDEKSRWSFRFLYGTLRLTVKLNTTLTESHQIVNNIFLESHLKETADVDCHFTHYLLMKKFSPEKLLTICFDTRKVLDVLSLISEEVKLMEHLNSRLTHLSLRYGMTFDRDWRAVFSIVSVNLRTAMEIAVDCSNWGFLNCECVTVTKFTKNGNVCDILQIARSIKCGPDWLEHFVKNSHDYIAMLETCT